MSDPAGTALPPLPHSGEALFLTAVRQSGAEEVRCEARVPAGGPYQRGGTCPAFLLIEVAAQAAAALDALRHDAAGVEHPAPGWLVRARDVRFAAGDLAPGSRLLVHARRAAAQPPLAQFETRVTAADGRELMRGVIGIYLETGGRGGLSDETPERA